MRIVGRGRQTGGPVGFWFDDVHYTGIGGDTLASALIANDVTLVGRSFKYHRPRGILTAGSEEPNALVTLGEGAAQAPNQKATEILITEGMVAHSQNRWPSLRRDVMSINDLVSPFLGAGFYYKTFMWPRRFWRDVYEPVIRKAAGLGALTGQAAEISHEKAWAHCDVLVIGAGPAGLMAALTAAQAGADVIIADEAPELGGRLLCEDETIEGLPAHDWASRAVARLGRMDNVRMMTRTTVAGAYDQGTYSAIERVTDAHTLSVPPTCFWRIVAKAAVLCAGAIERPIAFPDNDRPGIMMASGVRTYLHRFGVSPGQNLTVFANNDDAHRTAYDLAAAGVKVAAIIDPREGIETRDIPVIQGVVSGTSGRHALKSVTVTHAEGTRQIDTDCLAISGGWNPTVHLTCHMNGRPIWSPDIQSFVPVAGSIPGLVAAGAARGVFDTQGCLRDGITAANEVLLDIGLDLPDMDVPSADTTPYRIEPLWEVEGKGRKWIDFQNDVHVHDIETAALENLASVEHMKRYTTQGMATDQGKSSNVVALAVLADATGRAIPETGTTTFRPPYIPVPIAAMGAGGEGAGFAPTRMLTSHAPTEALGAPMIEAGLWYRPSYFPLRHEKTWRQSCDREVKMVRETVGICDVSTLGKIDVQGPDAAVFLDFVYANMISTLKVGKVRYGIMLREDGHVMDDGTVARLGDHHFSLTTTTSAAGQVMRHLDFVAQVLCPDLDVQITSVTESWAQFAVAGPKSRELLQDLLDTPFYNQTLPFMGYVDNSIGGTPCRLFRISFSGEHAYELAVPVTYGQSLFQHLLRKAHGLNGGPYGMEALNVMRMEKGFLTHAEMDGRTTGFDLGLSLMINRKKDCVGQSSAARPGLFGKERAQLVGLKSAAGAADLVAGAMVFKPGETEGADAIQGHVTSACHSPMLGHGIALGLLKNGRDRHGEKLRLIDRLRDVDIEVEVCNPVFLDPAGDRLRG